MPTAGGQRNSLSDNAVKTYLGVSEPSGWESIPSRHRSWTRSITGGVGREDHSQTAFYRQYVALAAGHITRGSIGTSFNNAGRTSQGAASIYRNKLAEHGYSHEGLLVDEKFLRAGIDEDGSLAVTLQIAADDTQIR